MAEQQLLVEGRGGDNEVDVPVTSNVLAKLLFFLKKKKQQYYSYTHFKHLVKLCMCMFFCVCML